MTPDSFPPPAASGHLARLRTWLARRRADAGPLARPGFTLLEMLIVLVLIGLLAGLVGPQLINRLDRSKVDTAKVQVSQLKSALDAMRLDLGRYPTAQEGLLLLTQPPADPQAKARWHGPYLTGAVPVDPWGNPYQYGPTGRPENGVTLFSYGEDGPAAGQTLTNAVGLLPPNT
ncbi:type II secretion system major pseudopilin GspG [Zavarzinia sp. CC-PAN008]|uniref:type II secretion system major pseudopilin GspG n=1 Tax=Zavarzinia sp. CC-PAN008 TaxID=3243332 RepID=UPI003F74924E